VLPVIAVGFVGPGDGGRPARSTPRFVQKIATTQRPPGAAVHQRNIDANAGLEPPRRESKRIDYKTNLDQ